MVGSGTVQSDCFWSKFVESKESLLVRWFQCLVAGGLQGSCGAVVGEGATSEGRCSLPSFIADCAGSLDSLMFSC